MSITSYNGLKEAVSQWLNRPDLDEQIPDFIRLAEATLSRRLDDNAHLTACTIINGCCDGSDLPEDFRALVTVSSCDGRSLVNVPISVLRDKPPRGGHAEVYAVANNKLYVWPNDRVRLDYRIILDALRFGPNWLMTTHPDAYLYASLLEATAFITEDEPREVRWAARLEDIIAQVNAVGKRNTFGGNMPVRPSGGV